MSDLWYGTLMFFAGFMSCFGLFFVLCYLKEIREAIDIFTWNVKHFLRDKGLTK